MFLIIDGYNLMHAAGMARHRYGPGDLERCRTRFLKYVGRHLTATERARTTIVFDAREFPADVPPQMTFQGMQILFAIYTGDADSLIEELIAEHSAPRQIRLVSSDRRLQRAVRRRRGTFVRSAAFIEELERRGPVSEKPVPPRDSRRPGNPKFQGGLSPEEMEEWLEIFGDVADSPEWGDEQVRRERKPPNDSDDLDRWLNDWTD